MAVKRVKFYCEYLIEDAVDDEDALEKADKLLNNDIETGWFCLDDYEIEDVEQVKKPTPIFSAAPANVWRGIPVYHIPHQFVKQNLQENLHKFLSRNLCNFLSKNYL